MTFPIEASPTKFCHRLSTGRYLLHRKQQRWKLLPSHCTSSAWYTVLPQAPHLFPPPQTGILQNKGFISMSAQPPMYLPSSRGSSFNPGDSCTFGFFMNRANHFFKRPAFLQNNLITSPKLQVFQEETQTCHAQVLPQDKGCAFSTTTNSTGHSQRNKRCH